MFRWLTQTFRSAILRLYSLAVTPPRCFTPGQLQRVAGTKTHGQLKHELTVATTFIF